MLLTNSEAKKAIYVDDDFDDEIIRMYISSASSFLLQKTGFDFSTVCEPMAKQFAIMYIRNLHFNSNGTYNKEYDYNLGINCLLIELQNKARKLIVEQGEN